MINKQGLPSLNLVPSVTWWAIELHSVRPWDTLSQPVQLAGISIPETGTVSAFVW